MDQHQIHHGGEGRTSHMGGLPVEVPFRIFPRQRQVCQGGGVPLVDARREITD